MDHPELAAISPTSSTRGDEAFMALQVFDARWYFIEKEVLNVQQSSIYRKVLLDTLHRIQCPSIQHSIQTLRLIMLSSKIKCIRDSGYKDKAFNNWIYVSGNLEDFWTLLFGLEVDNICTYFQFRMRATGGLLLSCLLTMHGHSCTPALML